MLNNDNYSMIDATEEQFSVILEFMEKLYESDLNGYWSMISEVDKSRIYGISISEEKDMKTIIQEIRDEQRQNYKAVKENFGISKTARYIDSREALMYLLKDVKTEIIFIAETQARVWPVRIKLEIKESAGQQYEATWKVRVFEDHEYNRLI